MYSFVIGKLMRRIYRDITAGEFRLIRTLAADDVTFVFPGTSSFGGTYDGKPELLAWLQRFAALHPKVEMIDVVASGPPWNTRVSVRFDDTIGDDYRNRVMEMLWVRWGKLRRIEAFLDTERISSWEGRHPELASTTSAAG
jgi:ketosteroid isomerase-like protein